jgi:hypothetical protein
VAGCALVDRLSFTADDQISADDSPLIQGRVQGPIESSGE